MLHLIRAIHDHSAADTVVGVLGVVAFIGMAVFFFSYIGFFNFLKTAGGRAVAALVGALLAVVVTNFLFILFGPDYWGRDVVRVIAWVLVVSSVFYLNIALLSNWARDPKPLSVEPRTGPTKIVK